MKQKLNKMKLFSIVFFSTLILFIKDPTFLSLILLLSIILSAIFKAKYKLTDRLKPLLLISLMVILFQVLFNTSLDLTKRLLIGVVTSEKIILLSLIVFLYTLTTSLSDIADSLSFLPKKMVLMLTITLGLIPSIIEESRKIRLVQQTRGYSSGSLNIYRSIIPVIIPLIHRTLARAEQLSIVLTTRGYEAE